MLCGTMGDGTQLEIFVSVDGAGLVHVYLPGSPALPCPPGTTWVEVTIKHEVNAGISEDVWRLYEAYECLCSGSSFTRLHGGSPICIAGQWEFAAFEHGEADFSGGLHGCEAVTAAALVVDGVARSLAAAWSGWAHRAEFRHLSIVSRNAAPATQIVDRSQEVTFQRSGFSVAHRLRWLAASSLDYLYLGMLPIVRTIGAEQVTHTAQRSPAYADENVSVAGFVETISHTSNIVRVLGDSVWTQTETTHREQLDDGTYNLPLAMGADRWEKVSNSASYNKVYMGLMGGGAAVPEAVAADDVLWATTHYTIRTDGGP